MKIIYAVSAIMKSVTVNNQIVKLEDGDYIIPTFDSYEKVKEYAGEAFKVIEFEILNQL